MSAADTASLGPEEVERLVARAVALLSRPGAWLDTAGAGGRVRMGHDRRRRPALEVPDAVVASLSRTPGLAPRPRGGCRLAGPAPATAPDLAGRPGVQIGERVVVEAGARPASRRANLGESPIAWLARRRGPDGQPWLSALEAAAGERLRDDFTRAGLVGRLTMSWDAGPRAAGGRGPGLDPAEHGVAAKARVRAALEAAGPGLAGMLEHVCLRGSALEAAERELNLPRRAGKAVLRLALQALARHYRLG